MSRRLLTHGLEVLEDRLVLDGAGFAGNDCPPNLDVTNVAAQTATVGTEFTLDLIAAGATIEDLVTGGGTSGDTLRFLLDPDVGTDTPEGASISEDGVFTWTPTADQEGTHTIIVLLVDEGTPALADSESFEIQVMPPANVTAPAVDANGADAGTDFSASFVEDGGAVAIVAADLSITDPDSTELTQAFIRLTNPLDGDDELLQVDDINPNISQTYDSTTGSLVLLGTGTLAEYEAVLRTLSYSNVSQHPDPVTRLVEIEVFDGLNASTIVNSTITIERVNDAPDLAAIPDATATLGNELVVTVTASDPDTDDMLTFAFDMDQFPDGAMISQVDNTTAEIRWTPDATHGPGPFLFSVIVTDNGTPTLADIESFMVTLEAAASPVVDLNGGDAGVDTTASFEEGSGAVVVAPDALVTDADSAELTQMVITLTNLLDAGEETLAVTTSGTLMSNYDAGTGVLTVSGTGTLQEYQETLRTLTYDNTSADPTTTNRLVTVAADDGGGLGGVANAEISVTAQNDQPNLTLPSPFDDPATPVEVEVGDDVDFTATAMDVDNDASELTYSLDLDNSGIPDGEALPTIDPDTGELDWMPTVAGCFDITVIVTDPFGGADQETFSILVSDVAASITPDPTPVTPTPTDPSTIFSAPALNAATELIEEDAEPLLAADDMQAAPLSPLDAMYASLNDSDLLATSVDSLVATGSQAAMVTPELAAYRSPSMETTLRDAGDDLDALDQALADMFG